MNIIIVIIIITIIVSVIINIHIIPQRGGQEVRRSRVGDGPDK